MIAATVVGRLSVARSSSSGSPLSQSRPEASIVSRASSSSLPLHRLNFGSPLSPLVGVVLLSCLHVSASSDQRQRRKKEQNVNDEL